MPPQDPHITSITPLPTTSAKWLALHQISYVDQTGRARTWESTSRRTRPSSTTGCDVVAMGTILLHPSRPPSTILVLQYRPPVDATTVEWPAGLINAGETPEEAAVRELREETGYVGRVVDESPVLAFDPGMTSASLKLVMVEVRLGEGDGEPAQELEEGEYIKREVVPLEGLYARLVEYSKEERVVVSVPLWHWAAGLEFARRGFGGGVKIEGN
ncbi:MAG: hypothetical protein Q9195_006113 [Heterodermia aff. obscurata]